ncbi:APC family permease [Nocardia sp. alder85J]|uniref:APC family permease n=1 Tax=Nocardia sp. alder85J TaxID=2862949 RepID=UPI001CD1C446|nr:amino acid permease [Nocardia sp. alder85J]MCX4091975.1 amino acid permease [Nocardia sp. alder85J]
MVTITKQAAPPTESIGLVQGVALYVCAILGAGVLVFPGQAASLAGPASLVAWGFSALMGLPLAFTFAALASQFPDQGGVATFAARAFGASAGGIAGWWYFIAGSVGQTIVPLTAGYYVADAVGVDQTWAPAIAAVILAVALAANLVGLRLGARVQIGLAAGVAVILLAVIAVAAPQIRATELTPFAPHGVSGIGQAVVVLFFAFAGWEAIAHLSAEFQDVRRNLPRATLLTILIVSVLYLGVAFAVVGTGSYGDRALDRISLGVIIQHGLGLSAVTVVAVAAVVICLGTTNAFVASVSRLGYALARDGWAPRVLSRQNRHGVPYLSVLAVGAIGAAGLVGAALFGWGTDDIVFVPSVLVLATYLLGATAAARLFRGWLRLLAVVTILLLLITVPFAGWRLLLPVAIAVVVLAAGAASRNRARAAGNR